MSFDLGGWLRSLGLERYEAAFRENACIAGLGQTADEIAPQVYEVIRQLQRCWEAIRSGGLWSSGRPIEPRFLRGYCNCCLTFSSPALTHSSSLPGEPDRPTPPITSLPTLIGTPPLIAITCGNVVCSRRTGRVFIS
jgi:hypothetical protein